jgi:hypothetical protein
MIRGTKWMIENTKRIPAVLSMLAIKIELAYSCCTIISDMFIVASPHSLNKVCKLYSLVYHPSVMTKAEPRADFTKIDGITKVIKFITKNKIRIIECFFLEDVIDEYKKIMPKRRNNNESTRTAHAEALADWRSFRGSYVIISSVSSMS